MAAVGNLTFHNVLKIETKVERLSNGGTVWRDIRIFTPDGMLEVTCFAAGENEHDVALRPWDEE